MEGFHEASAKLDTVNGVTEGGVQSCQRSASNATVPLRGYGGPDRRSSGAPCALQADELGGVGLAAVLLQPVGVDEAMRVIVWVGDNGREKCFVARSCDSPCRNSSVVVPCAGYFPSRLRGRHRRPRTIAPADHPARNPPAQLSIARPGVRTGLSFPITSDNTNRMQSGRPPQSRRE